MPFKVLHLLMVRLKLGMSQMLPQPHTCSMVHQRLIELLAVGMSHRSIIWSSCFMVQRSSIRISVVGIPRM